MNQNERIIWMRARERAEQIDRDMKAAQTRISNLKLDKKLNDWVLKQLKDVDTEAEQIKE